MTTPYQPVLIEYPNQTGGDMFKVVVGHSIELEADEIANELIQQCQDQLGDLAPKGAILFAGIDIEHDDLLRGLLQAFPGMPLIGGTTDGEVSSREGFQDDSATLVLFAGDTIEISTGLGRGVGDSEANAAREAVAQAKAGLSGAPTLGITVPDSMSSSTDALLRGLGDELGQQVPIFGGAAGDLYRWKKTFQFFGDEVVTNAVPLMLFSGPLLLGHGISSGQRPITKASEVTRSDGREIFEIDGAPAYQYYKNYLGEAVIREGEESETAPIEASLAVFEGESYYVRAPMEYRGKTQSVVMVGEVPQGSKIAITHTSNDNLFASIAESAQAATANYPGKQPVAGFVFSCTSRKQLMGTQVEEEIAGIGESFPQRTPIVGFYTYGEIGPLRLGSPSRFHNESLVTLLLGIE